MSEKPVIKWAEIASQGSRLRFDYLSKFLTDAGIPNKLDYIECSAEDFPKKIREVMATYDHIRVGSPFGEKVPLEVDQLPMVTLTQKAADCLIKEEGRWWARSMLTEGLAREVAVVKRLDIAETAFIIGTGASCRAVIAALLKMGFKKFNMTERIEERGRKILKDLQSTYFGVDFRFTPQAAVTMLPGTHSIVVNTTPFVASNDLLNELYYCNFLKPNGVVIDLTLVPTETPLLKAVKQVEGRIIHGYEVASLVDLHWVKTSMKHSLDIDKYTEGFKALCDSTAFDLTGFEIPEF